jgi:hypothetical protein
MDGVATIFPAFAVTPAAVDQIVALGGSVRIDVRAGDCCGNVYSYERADPDHAAGADRYGCPGAWLQLIARSPRRRRERRWTTPAN